MYFSTSFDVDSDTIDPDTNTDWSIVGHNAGNMVSKNAAAGGSQAQHIASVVMAYWVVSISMVYLNKVSVTMSSTLTDTTQS